MIENYKLIVTSYKNPDLDGVACMFAYTEFLCKQGANAIPVIAGEPHIEAKFVLDKFNISNFTNIENISEDINEVILIDTSDLRTLSEYISPNQVIKIIDHRITDELTEFPNANINNQKIGVSQLEMVNANLFVKENLSKIKAILSSIKTSQSLDIIFLSLIDVNEAFNVFVIIDKTSQNLIEKILQIQFKNNTYKTKHIVLRKEIIPLIREYLQD